MYNDTFAAAPQIADTWSSYDVPVLSQILAEKLEPGFDRVLAWGRVGSLMDVAADSLKVAIDNLSDWWDPASSAAAARFVGEASQLVAWIRTIADAANSNKPTLNRVLESFEEAKATVMGLAEEWTFNQIQEYDSRYGGGTGSSGVSRGWRQALNEQAHNALHVCDDEALHESRALQVPLRSSRWEPTQNNNITPHTTGPGSNGSIINLNVGPDAPVGHSSSQPIGVLDSKPSSRWHVPVSSRDGTGNLGGSSVGIGATIGGAIAAGNRHGAVNRVPPVDRSPQPTEVHPDQRNTRSHSPVAQNFAEPGVISAMPISSGAVTPRGARGRPRPARRSSSATWQTARGVPGVLLPSSVETVHDPGPGALGIDR